MWINKPIMVERRSFELLSLYNSKQPIFKNLKHFHINPKGIAIIRIYGVLTKKTEAFDHILDMTSYENIHEEIESALEDKSIETILLDIDSPGGEVNGVFDLADFIYESRVKKRIIAIANDDAYSAAYAIASSAEKVFVSRTSGVGSVGVIASHIDQSGFDEKQGIKYTTIFAGSRKNDLNPHEPMTSESLESLQKEVGRLYEMFLQLIARNRGLSIEKIRSTEAGLYFGEKAVEIGLADGVTTFFEFINNHRSVSMTTIEENCRREILEIIRLCNISKMPEKIGEFIEQGVSIEQAREVLMELLAERTKKTEIISAIPQNSGEELMMQVAKSRGQSNI
ncbi:S49 family peptidase [Wolbachia endosymbiont of Diaphorina citri]|jgi:Periplasmic serine proteases (ClpP class)|uniref:S49 family peptidase n=1 Tax=Wolbachia endosymbiont of Diaphorina citri TaxID=116598 RepID=UPI00155E46FD|nr:S49 family peptidase [Wolbachia endosymbiont of Diaphorina citri]QJT95025.1 S49 family peptidase [Wolbachia endosymbiont of Diaphorina citri]QJT96267.1 S49 family peptidase [Wolbachia endosymbiont of Diaphorina citri]QJT96578.1 S49 family peptidase [Wolbachia endosymbiont of Diaphorina citri]QLK11718.1 S49 family peptidase [Wolbachia endosymbiont of Diaphorina citri]QXY86656.1 S49 family peptidase [Wolbachia endosymbiont of Diaphorina citri]